MGKIFQALEKANQEGGTAHFSPPAPAPAAPRPSAQAPPRPGFHADTRPAERHPIAKETGPAAETGDDVFLDFIKRGGKRARPEKRGEKKGDIRIQKQKQPAREKSDFIHPTMVTVLKPQSVEAEQFRLLKNNILFPEKGDPPRSIMVTSPSPDEGKSFVSTNLAVSIAQSIDEYVMLIDCDLRAPSIHTLFGMENPEGLSEHLSSAVPLSDLLKKTFIEKLTILPGGAIPPNPSELLSSEQMRRLLNEVKIRYSDRYVIVDTPPPYITSETNAIARIVDGIIIVIRYGKTKKKDVEDIIDIYGRNKILGVIKNFSQKPSLQNYHYRRYGYLKDR